MKLADRGSQTWKQQAISTRPGHSRSAPWAVCPQTPAEGQGLRDTWSRAASTERSGVLLPTAPGVEAVRSRDDGTAALFLRQRCIKLTIVYMQPFTYITYMPFIPILDNFPFYNWIMFLCRTPGTELKFQLIELLSETPGLKHLMRCFKLQTTENPTQGV